MDKVDLTNDIRTVIGLSNELGQLVKDSINTILTSSVDQIRTLINSANILATQTDQVVHTIMSSNPFDADPILDLLEVLSQARVLASHLNRLLQPPFVGSATVVNGNLIRIAAEYYNGDITVWEEIADFNGIKGAQLSGTCLIKLPPINGVVPKQSTAYLDGQHHTVYETPLYPVPPAESARRGR